MYCPNYYRGESLIITLFKSLCANITRLPMHCAPHTSGPAGSPAGWRDGTDRGQDCCQQPQSRSRRSARGAHMAVWGAGTCLGQACSALPQQGHLPSALPTCSCTKAGTGPGTGQVLNSGAAQFLLHPANPVPLRALPELQTAQGSRPHPVCVKTSHCWPRGFLGCSDRGHSLTVA